MGDRPERGWRLLARALRNRKTAVMLVLGFAAGLPYTLLLGTLNAWLAEARVDLTTIGILSWIGLAYSFKFLWSPLVDRVRPPLLGRLGRRRGWLLVCQASLAVAFACLALIDPALGIGWFALVAVLAAFTAATQDVVIDAWRIDVADEVATLEILSTVYQFGYRIAALAGGALALVLAARVGWPAVYAGMGVLMAATLAATMAAPDTAAPPDDDPGASPETPVPPRVRAVALAIVGAGWAWALWTLGTFMGRVLATSPDAGLRPSAGDFVKFTGPWIVVATVVMPAVVAAWTRRFQVPVSTPATGSAPPRGAAGRAADHAFRALVAPLAELVGRLRWGALVVLGLILSYRLCDAIWGPFAFPFYLEELHYTHDEVAFASKVFGVLMTIAGIALGGILFAWLGRMPTLLLGAVVAAASNLLYADLAAGGAVIDGAARVLGIQALADALGVPMRMVRLMAAISGENVAGGLAGAAFIAYLSTVASRRHSAVQYALLSSLTFLVGSLGRGALGEAIERHGYAPVFRFTAALGLIAVAFCLLEWVRDRRATPAPGAAGTGG
jgi:PAT family beta-lactamase induction signal transducer AmpG